MQIHRGQVGFESTALLLNSEESQRVAVGGGDFVGLGGVAKGEGVGGEGLAYGEALDEMEKS
jgi:hypothetical protein